MTSVVVKGERVRAIIEGPEYKAALVNPVTRTIAWVFDGALDRVQVDSLEVFDRGFAFWIYAMSGECKYVRGRFTWRSDRSRVIEIVTRDAGFISIPLVALDVAQQLAAVATGISAAQSLCNTVFPPHEPPKSDLHEMAREARLLWERLAP
jgi:hypothetical protein